MRPVTSSLPFMCLTMFLFVLKPGRADGVRVVVPVGGDVILPCSPSTKEDLNRKRFQWMKDGQKQVFSYDAGIHSIDSITGQDDQFKGRVSFFPDQLMSGNASIKITNTQTADSGNYTCDLQSTGEKYIIHLVVVAINLTVKEDDDAILSCSFGDTDITQKTFDWNKEPKREVFFYQHGGSSGSNRSAQDSQFKHRVDHFPDQLKFSNASIVIRKTKPADSGTYTCDFPFERPQQRAVIQLTVVTVPTPDVSIVKFTENGVLLRCEVRGAFPKPDVRWQDSVGNFLHAEKPEVTEKDGRYHITVFTTVTKTTINNIFCVSEQEEISQRTESQIYVPEMFNRPDVLAGWIVAAVLFVIVAFLAAVIHMMYSKKRRLEEEWKRSYEL